MALAIALVSRWVCAAMACAKCVGESKENLSKMRRVGWIIFQSVSSLIFSKFNVVPKAYICQREKSLLENLSLFFETQICPGPIATNGLYMQRCRNLVIHCLKHKPYLKYKLPNQQDTGNDAYTVLWGVYFWSKFSPPIKSVR